MSETLKTPTDDDTLPLFGDPWSLHDAQMDAAWDEYTRARTTATRKDLVGRRLDPA